MCSQVFPPRFRDLPPPPLELYDLDEEFSTERARLAQAANKCLARPSPGEAGQLDDLEYFIAECSRILDIPNPESPFKVLWSVTLQIANFKKDNFNS